MIKKILIFYFTIGVMRCGRVADSSDLMKQDEPQPCGQYDFRCIDDSSFQICAYSYTDEEEFAETEAPEAVHGCAIGTYCDEDNPAYCTVMDPELNAIKKIPKSDLDFLNHVNFVQQKPREASYSNLDESLVENDAYEHNDVSYDKDDSDLKEVVKQDESPCQTFGYKPDISNKSIFWLCDHGDDGQSFVLRHMICTDRRIFDPVLHECVLIGSTRYSTKDFTANLKVGNYLRSIIDDKKPNVEKTKCSTQVRLKENSDCRSYLLCFNDQLTRMVCPSYYKFNINLQLCQPEHLVSCHDQKTIFMNDKIR